MIEINVLGPFTASCNGHDITWQPMQELLIQALLVAGRAVESHELADMLRDRPASTPAQTAGHISRVRKPVTALGGGRDDLLKTIKLPGGGFAYQLADGLIIDAACFTQLVSAGVRALRELRLREAAAQLGAALRLWRGDPLPGVNRRWWALGYTERLQECRKTAVIGQLEARTGLGHHREAVSELKLLARQWPDEDDIWKLLAIGLYRSGRHSEASQTCRQIIDAKRGHGHDDRQFLRLQQEMLSGTFPLNGPLSAPSRTWAGPAPADRRSPAYLQLVTPETDERSLRTAANCAVAKPAKVMPVPFPAGLDADPRRAEAAVAFARMRARSWSECAPRRTPSAGNAPARGYRRGDLLPRPAAHSPGGRDYRRPANKVAAGADETDRTGA